MGPPAKRLILVIATGLEIGLLTPMPILAQLNPNLATWHQDQYSHSSNCGSSGPGSPCYGGPGGSLYNGTVGTSEIGAGIQFYRGPGINARCCPQDCH